jgi:hypothetical protein
MTEELREILAAYAHSAWSGWMRYMFSKGITNVNGSVTLLPDSVSRWTRQMNTPYDDLPQVEKMSDQSEADDIIGILRTDGEL